MKSTNLQISLTNWTGTDIAGSLTIFGIYRHLWLDARKIVVALQKNAKVMMENATHVLLVELTVLPRIPVTVAGRITVYIAVPVVQQTLQAQLQQIFLGWVSLYDGPPSISDNPSVTNIKLLIAFDASTFKYYCYII